MIMKRALLTALWILLLVPSSPAPADTAPRLCLCRFVAPIYPPFARQVQIAGSFRIAVTFDSHGTPVEVTPLRDGPLPLHERLDVLRGVAVKAIKKWRFCPPLAKSDRDEVVVTFNFRLMEAQPSEVDAWSPTEITFEPPATVSVSTRAYRVIQR